jgi:hypothetical protein
MLTPQDFETATGLYTSNANTLPAHEFARTAKSGLERLNQLLLEVQQHYRIENENTMKRLASAWMPYLL